MDIFRYFEDVTPIEKLLDIVQNANKDVVLRGLEDFLKEVAELELRDEGRDIDFESKKERADQIALRLMSSIVSANG